MKTGRLYRVQCGAFRDKANAEAQVEKLKKAGFNAIIV
ncbi:SPOR domain-containing protein [Bacteroides heparinolyticus]